MIIILAMYAIASISFWTIMMALSIRIGDRIKESYHLMDEMHPLKDKS